MKGFSGIRYLAANGSSCRSEMRAGRMSQGHPILRTGLCLALAILLLLTTTTLALAGSAPKTGNIPTAETSQEGDVVRVEKASAQHVDVPGEVTKVNVPDPGTTWYLAEGYTGGDFDTWVLVQNPGEDAAQVTMEFQLPASASANPYSFELAGKSRLSIHLDTLPGLEATDVSTKVTSNVPVVVERAMYFDYEGKTGGHDSVGTTSAVTSWYLAEGYTGGDFDTWVLVQNPQDQGAKVTMEFQLPPGTSANPYSFELAGRSRISIHLDTLPGLGATDVSTKVTSDVPVVVERAMYFNYEGKDGGSGAKGVYTLSDVWFLAEGYTGGDFDTWVLVQNPGVDAAQVTMEFQLPAGASAEPYSFELPGNARQSIHLDTLPGLESTDVSTKVTSNVPVVVERAMYFNYEGKTDGHGSTGAESCDYAWYLAEGYTGGDFDTWVLVQNPGEDAIQVTMEFQLPPGASAEPYTFELAGNARQSIHLDTLPGLEATDVSTKVTSEKPMVVERSMYFNYGGVDGGTCSTGYTSEGPMIPETTKVVDEDDIAGLSSVSEDGSTLNFGGATDELKDIQEGDVMVAGATDKTPTGLLRKVTGVKQEGDGITFTTEQASLVEAVSSCKMSSTVPLTIDSGALAAAIESAVGGASEGTGMEAAGLLGWKYTFDKVLYSDTYGEIRLKGLASMDADMYFNVDVGLKYGIIPSLKYLDVGVWFNETFQAQLTARLNKTISYKDCILDLTLPTIQFMIGPVPVVFVPNLKIWLGADGNVAIYAETSVDQFFDYRCGIKYDGHWDTYSIKEDQLNFNPPHLTKGTISFRPYIRPEFSVLLYGVAGGYGALEIYAQGDIDIMSSPWWKLRLGIKVDVGVKAEIWDYKLFEKNYTIVDLHWDWQAEEGPAPFPTGTGKPLSQPRTRPGRPVTIDGSGFALRAPENPDFKVEFGNAAIGQIQTQIQNWTNKAITCVIPENLYGEVNITVATPVGSSIVGTYKACPVIDVMSHQKGTPGIEVVLTGVAFGPGPSATSYVSFGSTKVTAYKSWSNTQIVFNVPQLARGIYHVSVTTSAGAPDLTSQWKIFGIGVDVIITDIKAQSQSNNIYYALCNWPNFPGGANGEIVIYSSSGDFGAERGSSYVSFDTIESPQYISWSDTEIHCRVPLLGGSYVQVTVTTATGVSNEIPMYIYMSPG